MVQLTAKTIKDQQQLLTAFLENKSWDAQYRLIIQLGKTLTPMPDELKIEENQVKGCESLAWLVISENQGIYQFNMDSDTRVVKGLMKIITLIFQDKTQQEIHDINAEAVVRTIRFVKSSKPFKSEWLICHH